MMMMEEQLRKLVEHAEPKPKSFICVSGLKTWFIPPLEFPSSSRYHSHLVTKWLLQAWKRTTHFPNNHLKVSFDDGKTWMDTRIPTGC